MICVPTLHPAFLLRSADEQGGAGGTAKFSDAVVSDIVKARRLTREFPRWNTAQVWETDSVGRYWRIFPNVFEVQSFAELAARYVAQGGRVVVDVETSGDHPMASRLLCVGLGIVDRGGQVRELFCVPFLARGGQDYWTPADLWRVRQLLAWLFSFAPTVFHNGSFDTIVLCCHGMPVLNWSADSMQAHHVADGEMPMNLAYCASRKTDGRYWKDDVKGDVAWVDMDPIVLRSYNLFDIKATGEVITAVEDDVRRLGAWDLYQDEIRLCKYFARATWRGVAVDESRRIALAGKLRAQRDAGLQLMQTVVGSKNFDPAKPTHLLAAIYDYLKFPVVKTTKTGKPSTDKDAMVLLALYADLPARKTFLQGLIDFKSAEKSLSTWVENLDVLSDGRVHSSWKLLPVTGRFASSPNLQNLPIMIKKILMAARPGSADPTGWDFVGVDLSQAELRMIGYDVGDPYLLKMYELGVDVHTMNCAMFFGVRPTFIDPKSKKQRKELNDATISFMKTELPRLSGGQLTFEALEECPDDRWKPVRTLGKNGEFGSNYGGMDETLYKVLRAKRDPDTNELLFPDIELSEVSAILQVKKKIRPELIDWQKRVPLEAQAQGFHRCPISGRYRFFRGGFKLTEVTNTRIQMGVASHMNKRTLEIVDTLDRETGGAAQIITQVHDALTVECPEGYSKRAGAVMVDILSRPFDLPKYKGARLPADKADIGKYLNEV